MVEEISPKKIDGVVKKNRVVIIDCYTHSCQPCKVLSPMLAKFDKEYGSKGLKVVKIDLERNPKFSDANKIFSAPAVLIWSRGKRVKFKDELGNITDKLVGLMSANDYETIIEKLLAQHIALIKI